MIDYGSVRRIYQLFAEMLEYPTFGLRRRVAECRALLSPIDEAAARRLDEFLAFVEETPPSRLEEVYTGTFDLQVVCYPYVGYQIFGESYKRGAFMVGLKEEYRACGFSGGNDLPDHLAVVLRFLAMLQDAERGREVVSLCLAPALEKMSLCFKDKDLPYGQVILALLGFLKGVHPGAGDSTDSGTLAERSYSTPTGCQQWHEGLGQDAPCYRRGLAYQERGAGACSVLGGVVDGGQAPALRPPVGAPGLVPEFDSTRADVIPTP